MKECPIKLPVIVTNFKAYELAIGKKAVELAKIHQKVSKELAVSIVVAVQHTDIALVSQAVSIPVFAQHIDAISFGASTGYVLPEAVKDAGACGSLINHSERYVGDIQKIKRKIERARDVGLICIVCAPNLTEAIAIANLEPDLIAIEPPELIGGDLSVSKANPDIIKDAVRCIPNVPVLVGAGIKNSEDVRIALKLGAKGVLLASGVAKAPDPEAVLRDLANGIII